MKNNYRTEKRLLELEINIGHFKYSITHVLCKLCIWSLLSQFIGVTALSWRH